MSDAFIDRYEITDDGWHKKAEYGPWVKFSDHAAALRAASERVEIKQKALDAVRSRYLHLAREARGVIRQVEEDADMGGWIPNLRGLRAALRGEDGRRA